MPSIKRDLTDSITRRLENIDRSFAVRYRAYVRGEAGELVPTEDVSPIYGHRYNTLTRQILGTPSECFEIPVYPRQLEILTYVGPEIQHYIVSAPGAGKTYTLRSLALAVACLWPNTTWGVVAPTVDRSEIIFAEIESLFADVGILESANLYRKQITTLNGVVFEFRSAKRATKKLGSSIAGRSWDGALVDESQSCDDHALKDVLERGRRVGDRYRVYHSCTNVTDDPHWEVRLDEAEHDTSIKVWRVSAYENVFVDPAYWEIFRQQYSEEEFRRRILCERVLSPDRAYPEYNSLDSVRAVPYGNPDYHDITAERIADMQRRVGQPTGKWSVILGHDPGTLKTATVALKAFRHKPTGRVEWYVAREFVAGSYRTQDEHFRLVKRFYSPDDAIVVWDPNLNGDSRQQLKEIQGEGFKVVAAASGGMRPRQRLTLIKRLLKAADGTRRLYLGTSDAGVRKVGPFKLANALLTVKTEVELAERKRKVEGDPTDLTSALAYGLARFEAEQVDFSQLPNLQIAQ